MTQSKNLSGAQWWKFDFHTHTPASDDFMTGCSEDDKEKITPKFWLQKFIDEGIDCVAITDHNSGAWIDTLKATNDTLEKKIHLFPGVEISTPSVHILAIFDVEKTTSDIDSLLGAVRYQGTKGNSDGVTRKSVSEVVDIIIEHGGIAIPAHADKDKGLFELKGTALEPLLDNKKINAMELCDKNYEKPPLYRDRKIQWSEVLGSDTHNFRSKNFGKFTWIKMDKPSIEGLKLALIDGKASVNQEMDDNLNQHTELMIESLEINKAKYIGRQAPLECQFSPFLNTIIGGRGSGKSTMLEFMRFVFRRHTELPEAIKSDFDKYFQVSGNNLLTNDSQLRLIYQKDGSRYRLNWSADAKLTALEVYKNGSWQATDGEIATLFPVQIYSQKQIFELAKNPQTLLEIIDKDARVHYGDFEEKSNSLTHRYKQIRQKIGQIKEQIKQTNKLKGELADLNRQIEQIEQSGHKDILQTYRHRKSQLAGIQRLQETWQVASEKLAKIAEEIEPVDLEEAVFTPKDDLTNAVHQQRQYWQETAKKVSVMAQEAATRYQNWQQQRETAQWQQDINRDVSQYKAIQVQLERQGIDPEKYPMLLQSQAITKNQLTQMGEYQVALKEWEDRLSEIKGDIAKNRVQLTQNRQAFLETVLQGNPDIKIEVLPYGENKQSLEKKVRQLLQCEYKYSKDIEALMSVGNYQNLKKAVKKIYKQEELPQDKRFYQHLLDLNQEARTDFILWHPEDNLKITFAQGQALETGSAGQKCAALLAFILSYGDEPLLLDQPEDDLDNELIYDLIVKQIRATKHKRQIIIVTHNANIVVNGNAEMVVPMTVRGGQSVIQDQASIQNNAIRKKICKVLEGGEKAFSYRYKRIHLEGDNV